MVDYKEVKFDLHEVATVPLAADDRTYFSMDMIDEMAHKAHVVIFAPTIKDELDTGEMVNELGGTMEGPSQGNLETTTINISMTGADALEAASRKEDSDYVT